MRVSFLLSLFRDDIVKALLWTLVHSLWQGLALAILTGLVILFTRRSAPVWRYNILLGMLCLFIAGAGVTFFLELGAPAEAVGAASGSGAAFYSGVADTPVAGALYAGGGSSWNERLTMFFDQRANIIVAVWFIILAIRLMKLVIDLWTVQRLRYYGTSVPSDYWSDRVRELAQRIGIKRAVRILESSVVKAPMMAGLLKPVILTPLGLLTQLPAQEMEAILLHELAHIRRKDYLTNLLQCFAEVLFFFNPAVLWISSLIREERENCCDDIAVGETNNKRDLINALVSFHEYTNSRHVLAFAGGRDHLLRRVKRIVQRDDKTLDVREKFFLLTCLFITAGLTLVYSRQLPAPVKTVEAEQLWQAPQVAEVAAADQPNPEKHGQMKARAGIKEHNGEGSAGMEVTAGIEVPLQTRRAVADTSKKPAPLKDSLASEKEREWDRMLDQQREELKVKRQQLEEERVKLAEREKELEMERAQLQLKYLEAHMDTLPLWHQKEHEKLRMAEMQGRLNMLSQRDVELLARNQRMLRDAELRMEGVARLQSQRLFDTRQRQLLERGRQQVLSTEMARRSMESRDRVIKPVLEMLMDKGLVTQLDEVSFSLDDKELIVNGKTQPRDVFEWFRNKFLNSSEDYIKYSKHKGSESTSINTHKD